MGEHIMVATVAEELAAKEHQRKLAEAAAEEGVPRNALPPKKPAGVFSAKDLKGMKFDEAPKKSAEAITKHANAMARAAVNKAPNLPPENGWVMPPKKRKPGRPARQK